MPSYTAIPNSDIDASSPVTESLLTLMRDNPIAIAENAANSTDIVGLDPLSKIVLSNDAIAVFNNTVITSAHNSYLFEFISVVPVTDGTLFYTQYSTDNASTYITTGTYKTGGSFLNEVRHTAASVGSASGEGLSGLFWLFDPLSTTMRKRSRSQTVATGSDGNQSSADSGYEQTTLTAVNALKFYFATGNMESGTIRCYGRRK